MSTREVLLVAGVGWLLAFGIFLLVYGPMLLGAKRTSQGPQLLSLKTAKALDLSVLLSLIATSSGRGR